MKLRMQDNSIRYRLTRSEVDRLQRDGRVNAAVVFPGGASFRYTLRSSTGSNDMTAEFADDGINITVPEAMVRQWAPTDEVSIAASLPLGGADSLKILVEKDFACLTPREGEEDSDMFPHPLTDEASC